MIDRQHFFTSVRASIHNGRLTQTQVDGYNFILDTYEQSYQDKITLSQLSYCFATCLAEVGRNMQPIEEIGKGKGRKYGAVDPTTGHAYYGRGFVQLTWRENYERAKSKLGIDFVSNPRLALLPSAAARIMFQGMLEGWFTGKKLSDYINTRGVDYINARRIINGTDRATEIAGYARKYADGLRDAVGAQKPPVAPPAPVPAPKAEPVVVSKESAEGYAEMIAKIGLAIVGRKKIIGWVIAGVLASATAAGIVVPDYVVTAVNVIVDGVTAGK